MKRYKLTVGKQSITFSLDDLAVVESVLASAQKAPGQAVFRASGSGRVSAVLEEQNDTDRTATTGAMTFAHADDSKVVLTDC